MSFLGSYKRLDNLCKDLFRTDKGITEYIEEMDRCSTVKYQIQSWDYDYKSLKRLRKIRNSIVHEIGATEENLCTENDNNWLEEFYQRILQQTDPLAQYHKMESSIHTRKTKNQYNVYKDMQSYENSNSYTNYDNSNNLNTNSYENNNLNPDKPQLNDNLIVVIGLLGSLAIIIIIVYVIIIACIL